MMGCSPKFAEFAGLSIFLVVAKKKSLDRLGLAPDWLMGWWRFTNGDED
jgi:hypothetical protein